MDILSITEITHILGRILYGFFFLFFGVWNACHWRPTLDFMLNKPIILAKPFLFLGITIQSLAGFLLIIGLWVKLAALCLIPFTIISVFIFHAFWNLQGEERRLNMILFIANLTASLGGLLFLLNNMTPIITLHDLFIQ